MHINEECLTSCEYSNKGDEDDVRSYYVKLVGTHLQNFDVLNSMFLLENYTNLIHVLEAHLQERDFIVPPYDIINVLLTLCTTSTHSKELQIRTNDPYNVSRQQLNRRSISLLKNYIKILCQFDTESYDRYNLELLRCQFFIVIDSLNYKRSTAIFERLKRRKTDASVVVTKTSSTDETNLAIQEESKMVYNSYVSATERGKTIMGNKMTIDKLNEPGEFINFVLWTLSNSLSEEIALFLSSHECWMPLFEILLDLLVLRHEYFIKCETAEFGQSSSFVQKLVESPLAQFFKLFHSIKYSQRIYSYFFIGCDTEMSEEPFKTFIHPVFPTELELSQTFVPRTHYSRLYKIEKSMALRRKFIGSCFALLNSVPKGHKLPTPRLVKSDLIRNLSISLARFTDIHQFRIFFLTSEISEKTDYIVYLAEATLTHVLKDIKLTKKVSSELQLAEHIQDPALFNENMCLLLSQQGLFHKVKWDTKNSTLTLHFPKITTCILTLLKFNLILNKTPEEHHLKKISQCIKTLQKSEKSGIREFADQLEYIYKLKHQ